MDSFNRSNRMRPPTPRIHRTRAEERMAGIDVSPARLAAELERVTAERDAAVRKLADAEKAAGIAGPAGPTDAANRANGATGTPNATEVETARRERDEFLAALQRERAEFQNFKRRTAEEREASLGLAAEGLIRKVLALADDFDRAIESRPPQIVDDPWVEGITAIDRKLRQLLESEGVTPIEAQPGTRFDPRDHEAVANVPGSGRPDGEVVEELRRGYRLRDRVIRPALVAVAAGSPSAASDATEAGDQPVH
jgi:molecular chaperone GrpE